LSGNVDHLRDERCSLSAQFIQAGDDATLLGTVGNRNGSLLQIVQFKFSKVEAALFRAPVSPFSAPRLVLSLRATDVGAEILPFDDITMTQL
jgi:hypothetical protein